MAAEGDDAIRSGTKRPYGDEDSLSDHGSETSRTRKSSKRDDDEIIKGAWSPEEDDVMKRAVAKFGMDWKAVATMVKGRTSKQCRDRYKLKLDPNINHGPWTPEEDKKLTELHGQLGRQWTKIAKLMEGRTENSVKSRFASLDRSRKREWTDEEDLILRNCRARNLDYDEIASQYLPKRSEHAIKKRWERLFMRDLAKKIRNELPGNAGQEIGPDSMQPQLGQGHGFGSTSQPSTQTTAAAAAAALASRPGGHSLGLLNDSSASSSSFVHSNMQPQRQHQQSAIYSAPPSSIREYQGGSHDPHNLLSHHHQQSQPPQGSMNTAYPPVTSSNVSMPAPVPRSMEHHEISEVLDTLLVQGQDADIPKLRKRITAESIGPSSARSEHPFQFLSANPPPLSASADIHSAPYDGSGPSRRVSHRSGNLKRQTTSVTILRQMLGDPLP
mmetsp:Transcript_405/g.948  ORF Transcript_405/g.948 Transcript_405/m.948 type:complete len:442 (+) Transcript_405:832-2157(+)|eukprot:CAMPEP_0171494372 /NCGR_PEP_ID=MMETSP0958-20121227/5507_1 /TAXON_ID=87120 /ORGANISM="Aurantiochytrium limacinum, Strain ATCCMYA-1381" /LENGTH=441 /DNA_ID=CAMNT_0012028151 /DNA_START=1361 /DNA_END=2686 /DNA_ORIENTATION=+